MALYTNFIGLDIGKFSFVAAIYGNKTTREYENNSFGIELFLKEHEDILPNSLCVLEATGGYEMRLLLTLCDKNFSVHRANTRKVKNFIRSFGNQAKTDALDAKALALYGYERNDRLVKFIPASKKALDLYELVQRRQDLKQILASEKNRLQAPKIDIVKTSCSKMIKVLTEEVKAIDKKINALIEEDQILKAKKEALKTIKGIGNIIANELLVLMPELGKMNRREAASLAGVAPRANDSGKHFGYRRTNKGRSGIKPILFIAAMAARNSKSELKNFYLRLVEKGKKKMVALIALARKIIVIANARLKPLATV
jgi:transposase